MIECSEVLANLTCYVDGEGTAELRKTIEEHVNKCHRCWVVIDTTRKTLKIVCDASPFEVPLAVSARLYARLREVYDQR